MTTRKMLVLAIVAIGLAFLAVQAAGILQGSPARAGAKTEMLAQPSVRSQAVQVSTVSWSETISVAVLVPLAIAAACYFLARKTV